MGLAACVTLVKRLYLFFNTHHIPVVRMGLQASDGLTRAGDFHRRPLPPGLRSPGARGNRSRCHFIRTGRDGKRPDSLTITAHPTMISRVQGLNKKISAI
jgi:hypothetical protein